MNVLNKAKLKSGGLVVSQLWEKTTGLPWSEAKRRGLTDGSKDVNIGLRDILLSGDLTPIESQMAKYARPDSTASYTFPSNRPAPGKPTQQRRLVQKIVTPKTTPSKQVPAVKAPTNQNTGTLPFNTGYTGSLLPKSPMGNYRSTPERVDRVVPGRPVVPVKPMEDLEEGTVVSNFANDVGTRTANIGTSWGGSLVGDVVDAISPKAADWLDDKTYGFIPHTTAEQFARGRGDWNSKLSLINDAMISQIGGEVGGELLGRGIAKAKPVVSKLLSRLPKELTSAANAPLVTIKKAGNAIRDAVTVRPNGRPVVPERGGLNVANMDHQNNYYVTHQTDDASRDNIIKNEFNLIGSAGLDGTALLAGPESISNQIHKINTGQGHRGAGNMMVFQFPKSEFHVRHSSDLDAISSQFWDQGQFTIPKKYLYGVHTRPALRHGGKVNGLLNKCK